MKRARQEDEDREHDDDEAKKKKPKMEALSLRLFFFEHAELYDRITTEGDYLKYLSKKKQVDVPLDERRPIKRLRQPLLMDCPITAEEKEAFRTMVQPSQAWLDARESFLTTSRFGEMAGEFPRQWGDPVQYFRQITGRVLEREFTPLQRSYTLHGQVGEPIVKCLYESLTKCTVSEEGLKILEQPPFIYSASSDGLRNDKPKTDGIIEIKCNAVGDPRDYVPSYYVPQCMGAMATYEAPFCDFLSYWMRPGSEKRFLYGTRIHFDPLYWERLKMRLDYMAWALVHDRPPTGYGHLCCYFPLPKVKIQEFIFHVGTAAEHNELYRRKFGVLPPPIPVFAPPTPPPLPAEAEKGETEKKDS